MKKVVLSINTSWNVLNFRAGLCKELQKRGYEIIIIAPADEYSVQLEAMGFRYYPIPISNKGTNPIEDAVLTCRYYLLYRRIRPDIVLHFTIKPNIYATLAAGLLRIPAIINITGLGSLFIHSSFALKIAKILYKIVLTLPQKVFFQNLEDRNAFIYHRLVSSRKADLLPGSGINTEVFRPRESDAKKTPPDFNFLMIARLVEDKGVREYVHAARTVRQKHPNVTFKLLGPLYEGNPSAISSQQLHEWMDQGVIRYLGQSDHVAELIADADCIVLPSYREGMSRILLEAASMGKPIITTNVPGCKQIVEDGVNGYLCRVADASDLAAQMEKMLNLQSDLLAEMGRKSRQKVIENFDEQIIIDKYITAIETILNKKRED